MNSKELIAGIKIEAEHGATYTWMRKYVEAHSGKFPPVAEYFARIAADHLKEIPDYYTRLAEMEAEAKKQ